MRFVKRGRGVFWGGLPYSVRKSDQMEKSTSARLRRYRRKLKAPIVPPKRGSRVADFGGAADQRDENCRAFLN